jgi:NitT/TauT family transport system substrate-binding protein
MIRAMRLAATFLVAGAALAACGTSSSTSADTTAPVVVGTSPTLANAGLYYAQSQGFFSQRGVNVQITPTQSGSVAIPLLLNGQLQIAATDPLAAMLAISKNIPITIIAPANRGPFNSDDDASAILVKEGGQIKSAADLADRTIGVNALNGLSHVTAMKAIDALGGDSSKARYVEVPLPQMAEATARGQVDAVVTNEPFVSAGLAVGLTRLATPFSQVLPDVPQVVYVATTAFVAENPDTVTRFREANGEANSYLGTHPDEIRTVGRTSTQTPPEVLDTIRVPVFADEPVTAAGLQPVMDMMLRYGVLTAPIDLSKVVSGEGP